MYIQLLKKIYDLLIDNVPLTKENLNQASITDEQINELIENGLIYVNKFDTYSITSVNKLYLYGKQNLLAGNKRTAQECFVLCYRLKPKHRETCLQMFYHAVLTHRYDEAYEYLYALENVSTNEHLRKEYKIYLYLLSLVSEVPENYQEKLEAIHNDQSLLIHKKPKPFQKEDNIVMELILKGKYKFAIENLNNFLAEDFDYVIHRLIMKTLLSKKIDIQTEYKLELLDLVQKKRYREIVTKLEEVALTRDLMTDEKNILEITRRIIEVFETGAAVDLAIIENNATSTSEAIRHYDYEKALEIETKFSFDKKISLEKNPVYILLFTLNQLTKNINRLKENNVQVTGNAAITN